MDDPKTTQTVGMPAADSWVSRRNCSPPGTKTSAWRGRSAPPDSVSTTRGSRFCSATSMARSSLAMVVGLVVPPRTVGSFATTRHWVPDTSASGHHHPAPQGVLGLRARPAGTARARGCPGRPAPRAAGGPAASPGTGGARRSARRRPLGPWQQGLHLGQQRLHGRRGWRTASGSPGCSRECRTLIGRAAHGGPPLLQEGGHALGGVGRGEQFGRQRGGARPWPRPSRPAPPCRPAPWWRPAPRASPRAGRPRRRSTQRVERRRPRPPR